MSDWEIRATSKQLMDSAVKALGFTVGDGWTDVVSPAVRYCINIYGQKTVGGVTQTGYYAVLRWESATPFPPTGYNLPAGVTVVPLPANSPVTFA
jgi:hypothetical protein